MIREKIDGDYTRMLHAVLKKNPGSNIQENNSFTAAYLPSHNPSKYNVQDVLGTDDEVMTNI